MKKAVMTMFIMVCIVLFACLICVGCGNQDSRNQQTEFAIEQKIVFVCQHVNWADGYVNYGFYIDNYGSRVDFDVSLSDEKYSDINELITYLHEMDNRLQVTDNVFSLPELCALYTDLYKIERNSKTLRRCFGGADMGETCFYGIVVENDKEIPVLLMEKGNWETIRLDIHAQKILECIKK